MSGLQARGEDQINGVDVREQGSALRVATNTPHLVSLGTGRFSTAVTLHPIKQGRVTIGSDPTCDIYVVGTGVASVHCRVENSHGVVTLYPISGSTLLDGLPVDKPTRLSQGSMLTIGRSNYLRFNHPEEAKLMKSVLPSAHVSMAPIQFQPNEQCVTTGFVHTESSNQCYQNTNTHNHSKDSLTQLDRELDLTLREMSRKKPPVAPRKPYRDLDYSDSDQETKSKMSSIKAKVSKFEYYAKQQKIGRSQFYTTTDSEISPKVFSSNSLTVNTPAKDVLGGRNMPNYMKKQEPKISINENNANDHKSCSYANVSMRSKNKIEDIVRNFDENSKSEFNRLPKKINNDQVKEQIYGKINNDFKENNVDILLCRNNVDMSGNNVNISGNNVNMSGNNESLEYTSSEYGRICTNFERNMQYSPVYSSPYERSCDSENRRIQAYQDRIKEEEQKEAETARLEEILNMCAEYERQITSGTPMTPTEKRPHNKIITNGSLPRSVVLNNPNFVQTSDGYFKFDTSHNLTPIQRNLSSYENFDTQSSQSDSTPEITIRNQSNYENVGRMDEIGIPVFEESPKNELSSPVLIRKLQTDKPLANSPVGSPYENVYYNRGNTFIKPKSPNTQSPRTRIKTSFAHKNLPSPQYFVFPTPPPLDNKSNLESPKDKNKSTIQDYISDDDSSKDLNKSKAVFVETKAEINKNDKNCRGIEKQLSVSGEIPMIDDDLTNDIELRYSKVNNDAKNRLNRDDSNQFKYETVSLTKNQSFEDVKKELMADIPELEEFEKCLGKNKREKVLKNLTDDLKKMDLEADSIASSVLEDNIQDLKVKCEGLKEDRRKLAAEIHEIKCKMSEIRSQEDDILRELEMEKALIKGEYDSEIAILNIEQKKRTDLLEKASKLEEEMKQLKEKQEARQNATRDRVELATMKVERIEKALKDNNATVEELQNAQEILDNETKISEDLEFQQLEEESELLANREDLQNDILLLTKKIDSQKSRILTLKSEANNNLTSALDETKVLQAEYVRLLNQVEGLTGKLQGVEKELKPIVAKLNELERAQSPDSAFYTDQNRGKSGEFGYSQSSDSDDNMEMTKSNFEDHSQHIKEKFNSIDQMSQSMIVDIERKVDLESSTSESPTKKKGFWERNFDSLKRKKKQKTPEKVDIMSQSLNENFLYNNENIENDVTFDKFNSLRHSKSKKEKQNGPVKSSSSSKIPTFAALGKIIKKDSFGKRSRENSFKKSNNDNDKDGVKTRYVKNAKPANTDNKYAKAKSLTPEKTEQPIKEENEDVDNENQTELRVKPNKAQFDVSINKQDVKENAQEPRKISLDDNVVRNLDKSPKIMHRKSCGDEPSVKNAILDFKKIADVNKIPSQDDIDRISKVTMESPIFPSDADMNSLGKRTLDSLMEIERKRLEMLGEQGCQVIENEREKISELKRRAQDETKRLWDRTRAERSKSPDSCHLSNEFDGCGDATVVFDTSVGDGSLIDDSYVASSLLFDDSSMLMSSSIEELPVRNSRTESTEDEKRSDDSRPLSHASDFSRDNILSLQNAPRRTRRIAPYSESQRPLTRFLPVDSDDFDLRRHVDSAGHQVELCPYVIITPSSCRGYLHKLGAKFHTWSKRWFVFDRETKTFIYYWDKSERKPRGGAYFQVIEEVYIDHGNTSKSPNPQTTFIVKTRQRKYYLMAPSGEAARIWIDVIFTGAQGYAEYLE